MGGLCDQAFLTCALTMTLFISPAPNGVKDSPHSLRSMATSVETVTVVPAATREVGHYGQRPRLIAEQ